MRDIDKTANIIKVFASIIIILHHIPKMPIFNEGNIDIYSLIITTCCAFSINIFFLVSGFFIYNSKNLIKSWIHVFIKFFINIFLVFLIVSLIAQIFKYNLIDNLSPIESIKLFNIKETLKIYLLSFRHLTNAPFGFLGGHMWFIYSYLFIIIFYPITWIIIKKSDDNFKIILSLIIILIMLLYDYHMFNIVDHRFHIKYGVLPILYSFIGYTIKNVIVKKYMHMRPYLFVKYLIAFIITYTIMLITVCKYHLNMPNHMFYYESWLSGLAILNAVIFILMLYSIKIDIKGKMLSIINFIAKNNIYIYLIHPYIIVLFYNYFNH